MREVLVGVLLFVALVMVLVTLITMARALLLPRGDVAIRVNGERTLVVAPGGRLLGALAAEGIFLPAACGGAGTCGLCRVRVLSGAGVLLPTERAHLDRRAERHGLRLACQVPVKRDLEIEVPVELFAARRWPCRVRSNRSVATFIKELVLELPPGAELPFRAGGYVQVEVPPHEIAFEAFDIDPPFRDAWTKLGLWALRSRVTAPLTRAYSLANGPGERGELVLNVRIATAPPGAPAGTPPGRASSWLFGRRPGDDVTVAGPFGSFFIHDSDTEMLYLGGGAGMAPLRSHILELLQGRRSRRRISYWYGARSRREAFYVEEFGELAREHANFTFHLVLSEPLPEDAWTGPTGFVHQVAHDTYLATHEAPEEIEYYLCGPPVMIAATRRMLDSLGVGDENVFCDDFGG